MPTRKLMDLPMLRLKHYFSYLIHPSWQIFHPQQKFYMDVLHKEQFFQDHPNVSIYPRFWQKLIQLQVKQKENFDKAYRAKDLCVLKVKEKVQFFLNKQGTSPLQQITGTVTEILECGCLYMVQAPNSRVYRRNRAHLKPICHDGSSFQDHLVKKEKNQPKNNSFQDHQPSKVKSVSFQKDTSYMDTRSMLFDEPDLPQHPLHHLHHHPHGTIDPDHHHAHPLHHFHPENHQWSQAHRTPHLKAGKDTSLNQLSSDPMTLTEDSNMEFQLY